jgi:pimeloyl-ACP methyl ester carboxylesterase
MAGIPVYCISGLGANERVFERLELPGCTLYPLPWLQPEPEEPADHYATRMSKGIQHDQPVLMGLSFGGMMASRMAHQIPLKRLWLISTVTSRKEMPGYMRWGRYVPFHELAFKVQPARWMGPIENYNLGVETQDEIDMVAQFRASVDPQYLRWALETIIHWEDQPKVPYSFHVHGAQDRIFPIRHIHPDATIANGGHFMVHNRAAQVSQLLQDDLRNLR